MDSNKFTDALGWVLLAACAAVAAVAFYAAFKS